MTDNWAAALARYASAMASLREPLTEASLRVVQDALAELSRQHYEVLVRSQERAGRVPK